MKKKKIKKLKNEIVEALMYLSDGECPALFNYDRFVKCPYEDEAGNCCDDGKNCLKYLKLVVDSIK